MIQAGLSHMLAQAGADKSLVKQASSIESMPGGPELLYTYAAEQMMKDQGIPKKDYKKIRLYSMGGPVKAQRGGSTRDAAERTRRAGRGDDSMMLHVSPEEYEVISAMWGPPEVNPNTGIGEYGFLSKTFKKLKSGIKKIVKSPAFQIIAPIALNMIAPGLGAAIGGALGASGTAATVVGNAVIRGGLGAAAGGKEGAIKGAVSGAVAGGLGEAVGTQMGLEGKTADIVGSSIVEGAGAEVTGGDFTSGAIQGGLSAAMTRPMEEDIAKRGRTALALDDPDPGSISLAETRSATADELLAGAPATVPVTASPVDVGATAGRTADYGALLDVAHDAAPMIGAQISAATPPPAPAAPPGLPESFGERLPVYTMNRKFRPLEQEADYFTYGGPGARYSGQALFLDPDPFPMQQLAAEDPGGLEQAQGLDLTDPDILQQMIASTPGFQRGGYWDQNADVPNTIPTVSARGNYIKGPGSGRSDDIPAVLSDGEYVIDAESVALLGDGSSDEGAQRLDEMRRSLRKHKGKNLKRGEFSHKAKRPEKYMGKLRRRAAHYEHGGVHNG